MAREEIDREDLIRDGTAMVVRAECRFRDCDRVMTIGFRSNGAASFYFDTDWVWQFDRFGRVRRGFDRGRWIKAERGQLVVLERHRSPEVVIMSDSSEDDSEASHRLQRLSGELRRLGESIHSEGLVVVRAVPNETTFRESLRSWLQGLVFPLPIAWSPHASSGKGSETTRPDCREK